MENGLDFIRSGIEIFFSRKKPEPLSHKYAILHVYSGVLLLLKERLSRAQPSLVFVNPAEAGIPDAKTIDYPRIFKRLRANGIHIDPTRRAILDDVRDMRNAIEHYRVELTLARSTELIAGMVSFVYTFCRDELDVRIDDRLSGEALDHFYDLKEVADRLRNDLEESAIADWEADELHFRDIEDRYATMSPEELLRYAASADSIPSEDVPLHWCPGCERDSVVFLEVGACTNPKCRATYRLNNCRSCYEVMISRSHFSVCDLCFGG